MHFGVGAVSGLDYPGQARPTLGHYQNQVSWACFYPEASRPCPCWSRPSFYLPTSPKGRLANYRLALFCLSLPCQETNCSENHSTAPPGGGVYSQTSSHLPPAREFLSVPLPDYSPPPSKKILPILGSCHSLSPSPPTLCSVDFPITPCGRGCQLFPDIWFPFLEIGPSSILAGVVAAQNKDDISQCPLQLWLNSVLFVLFLAMPRGMWDLSSLTRDWTCNPCSRSMES